MSSTRRGTMLGIGASALLAGHQQAQAADSEKALYEAAKKEGELTWYTAQLAAETAEKFGRAFMAKYPGIKVNVVRTTAQVAYQRLNQELKAGGPQVDVFASTVISHCIELKNRNLLEKYVPTTASTMLPDLQNVDPDGFYHTTSVGVIGITYNSAKVKAEDAPRTWPQLVDIKWKNQVSVGHPGFSGYVGIWVYEMNRLYGWQYFEKLKATDPQIGRSIQDTLTMLRSAERTVAAGSTATAIEAREKGEPLGVIYPDDGVVIVIAPSGIVKGCKHPNAARLFMEYSLSPDASRVLTEDYAESMHADVPPPKGAIALNKVKTIVSKPELLLKGVPAVIEKWRDTFGI